MQNLSDQREVKSCNGKNLKSKSTFLQRKFVYTQHWVWQGQWSSSSLFWYENDDEHDADVDDDEVEYGEVDL